MARGKRVSSGGGRGPLGVGNFSYVSSVQGEELRPYTTSRALVRENFPRVVVPEWP